jgi:glycosyltransferase involved in cell wall biosynthesis
MTDLAVIVTARNEAKRLPDTLEALAASMPGAVVVVADDASTDATAELASALGVEVVKAPRHTGKGGVATLACRYLLDRGPISVLVLCDADLGRTACALPELVAALSQRDADVAVASFSRRIGGGLSLAVGFARWAVRKLTGIEMAAPISGQRALRGEVLSSVLPFARGFGMEIAMTVDAHRAGFSLCEVELDLYHRATTRSLGGFAHRGRQLVDFVSVYALRQWF